MNHIRPLDGLRALAILIVFLAHCGLERVIPGGFGVTIFFFLSGYLITSLLRSEVAQTGRVDLGGFYLRRTVRIWPSLYITLPFALLLGLWVPTDHPVDPWGVLAQFAFVTNYASLWGHPFGADWIPLWSLAVEEHFYLLFPLLFATLFRTMPSARVAAWCAAGCVLVLAIRIVTALEIENIGRIYYWSHTRVDSILFGCCLALWQNPALDRDAWRPRLIHVAAALVVLLLCLVIRNELFRQTLRYSLQGAALFVLFSYVIADKGWAARLLSSSPARLVALYSYTLYLVHVPMIALVQFLKPGLNIVGVIAASGLLSMAYAAAMYALVERPAARWRRSLHKVDAKATDADPAIPAQAG
jgi:peptidoglycan/LPS O-acetylase OafA/YrhL